MIHFAEMTDEERFVRLEQKAADIRKTLFGVLFMAKDAWKDDLLRRDEGLGIIDAMEKAEESFPEGLHADRLRRLEQTCDVINQRAKALFDLMSYLSKYKKV